MKFDKEEITKKLKKKEELTDKELKYALKNIQRRCVHCDKKKLIEKFNIQKAGKYGRNGCCRKCVALRYQSSSGEKVVNRDAKIKKLKKKIKELEAKIEKVK
jgi:hypothetical protein